ncbi:glycosyltransferase [Lysobacter korlensis]|uniref:Glycosyltransferase n=1 Tax=Lysobacter korlensis TaxID=553636 RepID=A0ABV6RRU0_9GAMM
MISFIVPAHNEARLIGPTLEALHTAALAAGRRYELIVVDDASDDDTARIAAAAGARVVPVEYRHIAATRNAGARAAAGDTLVFVDADTLVPVGTLRDALDALDGGAAGGGARLQLHGRLRWVQRVVLRFVTWLLRIARIAPGCFVFCTAAAYAASGGFDERYYAGEDVAFSRALARHGRFVVLRAPVSSSARKLRTHSLLDHLRLLAHFARRRRGLLRSRQGLDLWYGERRHEPDHD